VTIVQNGIYDEDRFGIFAYPDGGKGAILRDPDGNLLALRAPAKR
jgi:predicted enzyme related to lactoylglutathione lyase